MEESSTDGRSRSATTDSSNHAMHLQRGLNRSSSLKDKLLGNATRASKSAALSLSGLKSRSGARDSEEEQREIMKRWLNQVLEPRDMRVEDLFEDLKSGFILHAVCEVLSNESLKPFGKLSKGTMRIQMIANLNVCFKYMKTNKHIRLLFVGPNDVVDGNEKLVMGLLWSLMEFYALAQMKESLRAARDGGSEYAGLDDIDIAQVRTRLIHWLQHHSRGMPSGPPQIVASGGRVSDITSCLADGRVLLAVLAHFDAAATPYDSARVSGEGRRDLALAIDDFYTLYKVDKLIGSSGSDGENENDGKGGGGGRNGSNKLDERITTPYLVQVVRCLKASFPDRPGLDLDETYDEPLVEEGGGESSREPPEPTIEEQLAAAKEAAIQEAADLQLRVKTLELENEHLQQRLGDAERVIGAQKEAAAKEGPLEAGGGGEKGQGDEEGGVPLAPAKLRPRILPASPGVTGAGNEGEAPSSDAAAAAAASAAAAHKRVAELEHRLLASEKSKAEAAARHAQQLESATEELRALRDAAAATAKERSEEKVAAAAAAAALEQKLRDADTDRRKLHNVIQELRGNVRVFARVRPWLSCNGEAGAVRPGEEPWLRCDADGQGLHALCYNGNVEASDATGVIDPKLIDVSHSFSFDRTFSGKDGQATVFIEVSEFVTSALDGYNVCLFSYGQTGSGKTHTMTGAPGGEERGIIPRAIEQVAERKAQLENSGWTFEMQISFIEIYCEQIRDLLGVGDGSEESNKTNAQYYKIIKNEFGQNIVTNVEMVPVDPSDANSIDELMKHAAKLRSTAATNMNAHSSRSHSIFTLHLTATHIAQGLTLHGQLNLVDLAGSERVEKSGVTGQALTEAKAINVSLSALAGVFQAISKGNSHVRNLTPHIPFRDSKLTELLHPALSGNGKTLMMLNLSPLESSLSESISSLRFGTNVNSVELGKAKRVVKRRDNSPKPRGRDRSPVRANSMVPTSGSNKYSPVSGTLFGNGGTMARAAAGNRSSMAVGATSASAAAATTTRGRSGTSPVRSNLTRSRSTNSPVRRRDVSPPRSSGKKKNVVKISEEDEEGCASAEGGGGGGQTRSRAESTGGRGKGNGGRGGGRGGGAGAGGGERARPRKSASAKLFGTTEKGQQEDEGAP